MHNLHYNLKYIEQMYILIYIITNKNTHTIKSHTNEIIFFTLYVKVCIYRHYKLKQ